MHHVSIFVLHAGLWSTEARWNHSQVSFGRSDALAAGGKCFTGQDRGAIAAITPWHAMQTTKHSFVRYHGPRAHLKSDPPNGKGCCSSIHPLASPADSTRLGATLQLLVEKSSVKHVRSVHKRGRGGYDSNGSLQSCPNSAWSFGWAEKERTT